MEGVIKEKDEGRKQTDENKEEEGQKGKVKGRAKGRVKRKVVGRMVEVKSAIPEIISLRRIPEI